MEKLAANLLLIIALVSVAFADDEVEVLIRDSRIELKREDTQIITLDEKAAGTRPTLDAALQAQSNIQVVPTPLGGSNLSLNGLSGEQVAISCEGDPVLGRLDGALDTRGVPLGSAERIAVYQGLDSLPYGSQNIGGVVAIESPWLPEQHTQFKTAGGNFGAMLLEGKLSGSTPSSGLNYSTSAAGWRNEAVRLNPDALDTTRDGSGTVTADAIVSKLGVAQMNGSNLDVRVGASGLAQNLKGEYAGGLKEGDIRRTHIYSDVRRDKSSLHLSYSEYRNELSGFRHDLFAERAFRAGPEIQESFGGASRKNITLFAGAVGDAHTTESTRITSGKLDALTFGSHLGARYIISDHWVAGTGTRYDSGPNLVSPRAEIKHLFSDSHFDHITTFESGLGFREASAKERYLDFINPALRYHIVGNPDLQTERAWMTALRHTARAKRLMLRGSVFQVRVKNAIGFRTVGGDSINPLVTYSNLSRTLTHGAQTGATYQLIENWNASVDYQFLRGRNLDTGGQLFLQPQHRVSLTLTRDMMKGFTFLGQAAWTSRQGFFDDDRNAQVDDSEWAAPYWMTSVEAGYGFRLEGIARLVRVFGRVDNALGTVNEASFPTDPRTYLFGAATEL